MEEGGGKDSGLSFIIKDIKHFGFEWQTKVVLYANEVRVTNC